MAPPLFFLLIVAAILIVGAAVAFWGVRAGLWAKETSTTAEDPEADARLQRGERPEHTRVTEPGKQTFVDT